MNRNISDIMPFAKRLKEFRELQGWTQLDFANKIGINRVTLVRWENDTSKPSRLALQILQQLGFNNISDEDSNISTIPILKQIISSGKDVIKHAGILREKGKRKFSFAGECYDIIPAPYVINGPPDQQDFYNKLIDIQEHNKSDNGMTIDKYQQRLSIIEGIYPLSMKTSQYLLDKSKSIAFSWNSNYGPHGWHRYVGRFPSHLVRALLNHFLATTDDVVCDPFAGSGTTLVECRLLGIPAIGIEICPLSSLMCRTKSKFPISDITIKEIIYELPLFYTDKWSNYIDNHPLNNSHDDIIAREGNIVEPFSNYKRWLTPVALLGISIITEYASHKNDFQRDIILMALSSKMRSIGNVDVDVVRAEYSKYPRVEVDVLRLILHQLNNYAQSINETVKSHANIIGDPNDISIIESSILDVDIDDNSITHVITSPPYGIEALSYLRTHLLSYRCLSAFLKEDPYKFGHNKLIGSEYMTQELPDINDFDVANRSITYCNFFRDYKQLFTAKKYQDRALMMMKFFEDMSKVASRLQKWMKIGGKLAFVIGNKRIGEYIIPTDKIMIELFVSNGFIFTDSINHKLKTNNSNSQVPWQERIIQDEYVLIFELRRKP